jgi:pimeloyl-ACP methyl ester carboxylesterase
MRTPTGIPQQLTWVLTALALAGPLAATDALPRKQAFRESYPGVAVEYGTVAAPGGPRLRTVVTRPSAARDPLPALLLVGWLSCDSVEAEPGASDATARLLRGLATESGMLFYRVDKPGVGDSEGDCGATDFSTELAGYRAALGELRARPDVDPARVFLFGWSNGAGVAPLVAEGVPVAGYVVAGGWIKTWFEHMVEFERHRRTLAGSAPGDVSEVMKKVAEFYDLYLNRGLAPGAVLLQRPDLATAYDDEPERQYGRPAAFYQQLQALNLAAAWSRVSVPVLALYGEYDFIMRREDHETIAALVDAGHPGRGRFVLIPRMDHSFALHDTRLEGMTEMGRGPLAEEALRAIVGWLKEQTAKPSY